VLGLQIYWFENPLAHPIETVSARSSLRQPERESGSGGSVDGIIRSITVASVGRLLPISAPEGYRTYARFFATIECDRELAERFRHLASPTMRFQGISSL
jgi:hypothetical protein